MSIRQVGSTPVSAGQPPLPVSGDTQVIARLYGGSKGHNGNVYLCLQRGSSGNTAVGIQAANIQANAVFDFGYSWNTRTVGNTPPAAYDSLYLSGSQICSDIANPATTSFIRVNIQN